MHSHSLWLRPSPLCRPCGARWSVNFFLQWWNFHHWGFRKNWWSQCNNDGDVVSNSVLIISGWKWSVKFASHYSSSLLPFAHNQTCPQSCVTHKTDLDPNVKVPSSSSYSSTYSSYSSYSSFSSSSYPTTLAAYAPAAAYAGSALAHHGPLTIRQPIKDFISFAKF